MLIQFVGHSRTADSTALPRLALVGVEVGSWVAVRPSRSMAAVPQHGGQGGRLVLLRSPDRLTHQARAALPPVRAHAIEGEGGGLPPAPPRPVRPERTPRPIPWVPGALYASVSGAVHLLAP